MLTVGGNSAKCWCVAAHTWWVTVLTVGGNSAKCWCIAAHTWWVTVLTVGGNSVKCWCVTAHTWWVTVLTVSGNSVNCWCVCSTHMQDLQEVTQETHYENYRAEKLATGGAAPAKASRRWVVSLSGSPPRLMLYPRVRTEVARSLSIFAHWYSKYMQLVLCRSRLRLVP